MFEIINRKDVRSPLKVMEAHIRSSGDDPWTNCPWVQVGGLYLSVTQTANSSWPTLVRRIERDGGGSEGFVVFSGRHGTQAGQAVDASRGIFDQKYVMESEFYTADVAAAQGLEGVSVINVADCNTTRAIQGQTLTHLGSGKVVIYAWCHSIFTMMDHSSEMYDPVYQLARGKNKGRNFAVESRALWLSGKSISALTTEWYDWVP